MITAAWELFDPVFIAREGKSNPGRRNVPKSRRFLLGGGGVRENWWMEKGRKSIFHKKKLEANPVSSGTILPLGAGGGPANFWEKEHLSGQEFWGKFAL